MDRPVRLGDLRDFLKALCRYYSDFLETDFHAGRLPNRRIEPTDRRGRRLTVDLQIDPKFRQAAFTALRERFPERSLPTIHAERRSTHDLPNNGAPEQMLVPDGEEPSFYRQVFTLYKNREILDKHQTYLYFVELEHEGIRFPLFYVPTTLELSDDGSDISAEPGPVLFVNHRAIRHLTEKISKVSGVRWSFDLPDRQLYCTSFTETQLQTELQRIINALCDFSGGGHVSLADIGDEVSACGLTIRIKAYFAVAPQTDEALVTDYEQLLVMLQTTPDDPSVLGMLEVINGYLFENPETFEQAVTEWLSNLDIGQRFNYESPVPLNDEQRAIAHALRLPGCNRVIVEGPPGTGKSHTITALIFEALHDRKSVLLVSDKTEALDVVQDKINQVLDRVATDESFQNPILRLGARSGNYAKIFYEGNLEKIRSRQRALSPRETAFKSKLDSLKDHIARSASEEIRAVRELHSDDALYTLRYEHEHRDLSDLITGGDGALATANDDAIRKLWKAVSDANAALSALEADIQGIELPEALSSTGTHLQTVREAVARISKHLDEHPNLRFLADIDAEKVEPLREFPECVLKLRKPIVGWLFSRAALETSRLQLQRLFPSTPLDHVERWLPTVVQEAEVYTRLQELSSSIAITGMNWFEVARQRRDRGMVESLQKACNSIEHLLSLVDINQALSRTLLLGTESLATLRSCPLAHMSSADLEDFLKYAACLKRMRDASFCLLDSNYPSERQELEHRVTVTMSSILDKAVLAFGAEQRTDKEELRRYVRGRKRIPSALLPALVKAFPCIIVGIRELGSYVPMQHNLFDLVIIDEASQVSIAQALPAMLRGKKTVVLGDPRQFSNVKASFASKEINAGAFGNVVRALEASLVGTGKSDGSRQIEKARHFDVRTSILEFVRNVSNYHSFLRKHFRSYVELIDYSNDTFYERMLQVMKIRSTPISEVIEFQRVEAVSTQAANTAGNINRVEAELILQRLNRLADAGYAGTVGVITPFTDQQALITSLILESEKYRTFRKMRTKVMTFDSCQGEERDIVFYSMVERPGENILRYIFPKDLRHLDLEEEGNLRAQRLNVGFSRSRESVVIVHSKDLNDVDGEIGKALRHFREQLAKRDYADLLQKTDHNSPMESQILNYLVQTPFYREHEETIEIFPQFPIGELIRQLNPYASIPKYRADFLVVIRNSENGIERAIIEYDGLLDHHFESLEMVNELTYDDLRAADDVVRNRTIESYGYPVINLNKFVLRPDPVRVIDDALRRVLKKKSPSFIAA